MRQCCSRFDFSTETLRCKNLLCLKSAWLAQPEVISLWCFRVSHVGAGGGAVAWTHGDALFLTESPDNGCSRRLEHLPGKPHSAVCWVPSKVLDLWAQVQRKWAQNVNTGGCCWQHGRWLATRTCICWPTSKPKALGCLIYNRGNTKKLSIDFILTHLQNHGTRRQTAPHWPVCGPVASCAAGRRSCWDKVSPSPRCPWSRAGRGVRW